MEKFNFKTNLTKSHNTREQIINIFMCSDRNMIMPMTVSLTSVLNTLQNGEKVRAFLFTKDINEKFRQRIENLHMKKPIDFFWGDISNDRLKKFARYNRSGWPPIIFYRILLGDLLPDDLHRVIYLDADTLICKPIFSLYNIKLDENIVAAATDLPHPWFGIHRGLIPARRDGLPADSPYFNSGVMVIDLKRYREERIGEKAIQYATKFAEWLNFPDQDALNVALYGYWKHLDPRWNQLPSVHTEHGLLNCLLNDTELAELRSDPWIIHYTSGLPRPWFDPNAHPLASKWNDVFKLTGFSDRDFPHHQPKYLVSKVFKRIRRACYLLLHG